jgi:hypothetical protein
MAWKLATGFVLIPETWLGPERTRSAEEAVLTIGVSHHERMAVIRRIRRTPALAFGPVDGCRLTRSTTLIFGSCPRYGAP